MNYYKCVVYGSVRLFEAMCVCVAGEAYEQGGGDHGSPRGEPAPCTRAGTRRAGGGKVSTCLLSYLTVPGFQPVSYPTSQSQALNLSPILPHSPRLSYLCYII